MLFPYLETAMARAVDLIPLGARALILAPLFFFGTWAVGIFLLSWSSRSRRRSVLAPGGLLLGFSAASVFLNAAGLLFGWHVGTVVWVVLGVCRLKPAHHALCASEPDDDWRSLVRVWKWLIPLIVILGALNPGFDSAPHYGFQTLIGRGIWPLQFPYEPSQRFIYHYGFNVAAAPFVTFGIPSPAGSFIWMTALQWALISFAFVAVGGWIRDQAARWRSVAIWALAESLGWILRPFRGVLPEVFQKLSPFYSSVAHGVFVTTYARSFLPAFACVLFLLWWSRSDTPRRARLLVPLFVLFSAAALSSETIFVSLLPFLGLALLATAGSWRARMAIAATLLAVLAVVAMQGGVLSDAVMTRLGFYARNPSQTVETSFHVRDSWSLLLFGGEVLDLRSPLDLIRLAFEMGTGLILFVAAFTAWRRWDKFSRWALAGAAFAFILGAGFIYDSTPVNILRFFGHAFLVTNFFGAIVLVPLLLKRPVGRLALGVLLFGGVLTLLYYPITANVPLGIVAPSPPFSSSPALWPPFLRQDYLPRGSILWVSEPKGGDQYPPSAAIQTPVIFGAYLKACIGLSLRETSDDCNEFYRAPSADGLARLEVSHLLLSSDWIRGHSSEAWFAILEPVRRYTVPEWVKFTPAWWREDMRDWTLYRVRPALK